jgi:hypothetical protein
MTATVWKTVLLTGTPALELPRRDYDAPCTAAAAMSHAQSGRARRSHCPRDCP